MNSDQVIIALALRNHALYICPKSGEGKREGPLVPYAGKYDGIHNFVGDIYFNFANIEDKPEVMEVFVNHLTLKLIESRLHNKFETVLGIPNGGRSFGQELARQLGKRFIYPEKKPLPPTPGKKQEYEWDLSRFDVRPQERIAVAEDVFNNFQNTDNTLALIGKTGAQVVLFVGALNRSPKVDSHYTPSLEEFSGLSIPVVCSIRKSFPEYRQDDPEVDSDVKAGNIEWEVKKNWSKLMALL